MIEISVSMQAIINDLNAEIEELKKRNELVWADGEILATWGEMALDRYAQMSPPEMFAEILRLERKVARLESAYQAAERENERLESRLADLKFGRK
jgi:predicted RNase H-like nuclease (RuvC/YqgF family)